MTLAIETIRFWAAGQAPLALAEHAWDCLTEEELYAASQIIADHYLGASHLMMYKGECAISRDYALKVDFMTEKFPKIEDADFSDLETADIVNDDYVIALNATQEGW